MSERGRAPGAKGTAFPAAQRPQRQGPKSTLSLSPKALQERAMNGPKPGKSPSPWGNKARAAALAAPQDLQKKSVTAAVRPARVALHSEPVAGSDALGVRVSKLMAERALCSRREADYYIERGWVFVDGERLTELGTRVSKDACITLAPEARTQQAQQVTILLHKPVGYVSGQPEPGYQPAVVLIRADTQSRAAGDPVFDPRQLRGLAPAGRLDIDSTGLLVLTQDGRIARQLIGESSDVEKEYLVRVEGNLIERGLQLLNHGLALDGKELKPAKVEWLNEDQLRFVLREGKKRQIRRMCELVGLKVTGLKRVRMGRLCLGNLPVGQWRYLKPSEGF